MRGVGPQPAQDLISTVPAAKMPVTPGRALLGARAASPPGVNNDAGRCPGVLLDVDDVQLVQHSEPGAAAGGGGQVLQHARRPSAIPAAAGRRCRSSVTAARPGTGRPRSAPAAARTPAPRSTVRGGDRQPGQPAISVSDVAPSVNVSRCGRDFAGDRPTRLHAVPGQAIPPRRWGSGLAGAASWLLVPARHQRNAGASQGRVNPVRSTTGGRRRQDPARSDARHREVGSHGKYAIWWRCCRMRGGLASGPSARRPRRVPCALIASHQTKI